jgi:TrkA domain protein
MSTTPLPGIGVRYDLTTREQRHLSVIAHRDGTRTLSLYRADDPDACGRSLHLTGAESASLIDALTPAPHSPNVLHSTDLGLVAERLPLSAHAYWNGRVLGETRMRTDTGASVVAVLRRSQAIPSPPPDFRLAGGDTLIVVGTREGIEAAAAILGRE